jgi:hypothetical protein
MGTCKDSGEVYGMEVFIAKGCRRAGQSGQSKQDTISVLRRTLAIPEN